MKPEEDGSWESVFWKPNFSTNRKKSCELQLPFRWVPFECSILRNSITKQAVSFMAVQILVAASICQLIILSEGNKKKHRHKLTSWRKVHSNSTAATEFPIEWHSIPRLLNDEVVGRKHFNVEIIHLPLVHDSWSSFHLIYNLTKIAKCKCKVPAACLAKSHSHIEIQV